MSMSTAFAWTVPFSMDRIEREPIVYPVEYRNWKWRLKINWPNGEITFQSTGFRQQLTGPVIETDSQRLSPAQRGHQFPVEL